MARASIAARLAWRDLMGHRRRFALSVALVKVTDAVIDFFTKAFKGMAWRPEVSEAER